MASVSLCNGVRDMLSSCPFISIEDTYLDGTSLLAGLRESRPDLLLLHINMPDIRGEEIILILRKEFPELTNFDNTLYASNMIKTGALGYLLKNTGRVTLIKAIETVAAGTQFLTDDMRQRIQDFQKTNNRKTSTRLLPGRQKYCACWLKATAASKLPTNCFSAKGPLKTTGLILPEAGSQKHGRPG